MAQDNNQATLRKLGELYPEQLGYYAKLKEAREKNMDEVKKLYTGVLQKLYKMASLSVALGNIDVNSEALQVIHEQNLKELQAESELVTVREDLMNPAQV